MHHAQEEVRRFTGKRVIVLGDLMLDTFVYGHCARISPEAPIPVVLIEREDVMLGGAGNVARNIVALGGETVLIGLVGADEAGRNLRARIDAERHITADLVEDGRPTTQKIRYIAGQQQMLRVDIEKTLSADAELLMPAVLRHLADADAVVLSDYAKGVLTPALLRQVIDRATALGKPVIADPKTTDIARYDGVTVLTPNAGEAAAASGIAGTADADAHAAADRLLSAMPRTRAVLVTRGAKGMTLAERGAAPHHLAAVAREVFDVSGAGDTVVATVALALASGAALPAAVEYGNIAAGLAVSKPGTAVVTADELVHEVRSTQVDSTEQKIVTLEQAVAEVRRWREKGETIGFTNGCFDLVHPGHVSQLGQARAACDRLIVGLNSDASIKRLKGPDRPIQDEVARAIVLASFASVDRVVLFEDDTPLRLIEALRPDVLVKGKDYTVEQVVGSDIVLGYGGRIVLADIVPGHSTTRIISRLKDEAA